MRPASGPIRQLTLLLFRVVTLERFLAIGAGLLLTGSAFVTDLNERRDAERTVSHLEAEGALLLRVSADDRGDADECEAIANVSYLDSVYVVSGVAGLGGSPARVNGDHLVIVDAADPSSAGGYVTSAGLASVGPGFAAQPGTIVRLGGQPVRVLDETSIRVPELTTSVLVLDDAATTGGYCIVRTTWSQRARTTTLIPAVSGLDAEGLRVDPVLQSAAFQRQADPFLRFEIRTSRFVPFIFGAVGGGLSGLRVIGRRRQIASLLGIGFGRSAAIVPFGVVAMADWLIGFGALLVGWTALVETETAIGMQPVGTISTVITLGFAMGFALPVGFGVLIFNDYKRYMRSDD